jgi:Mrp family chromosome partitioning ATPase
MLGMLPRLPEDLSDPNQAALAAHCVHEIRTLLQIWSRSSRHRVFAITSPNAGAGKTSLTLALGASYATANLRTLIVDCDLIAGALTRRAELIIKRMLGQILLREGLINETQLAQAVAIANDSGKRIGQVLVDEGLITPDDLETAIAAQIEQPVGILDAMHGIPIEQCVAQTSIPNLQILPVGAGTARDVPLLSPEALHTLMESLGKRFDVVLVDTGPILGSLEASLVAGAVDGVVLVVRKGDRQPLVERAMSQLVTVGARVAGVVFNGASSEDILTYGRANTRSDKEGLNGAMIPVEVPESGTPRSYGPLTTAVTNCAPAINRNSAPN